MRCKSKKCTTRPDVAYRESRMFASGAQVWLYKCPACKAEFVVKQDLAVTSLPVVAEIKTAEEDPTPLPGVVVSSYDILAANPDPEGRVWMTGGPSAGEVFGLGAPEREPDE